MTDTTVSLFNLTFDNPLLPASGPLVEGLENLLSLNDLPLGGLVTKTISVDGAYVPKPCIVGSGEIIFNTELWSEHPLGYWLDALEELCSRKTKPLGISVGYTAQDFSQCVPGLHPYADFFELSTHYNKEALEEIVKGIVDLTDKPVLIKLSPHIQEDLHFVDTALKHGACGIVALNSFGPGLVLDLKRRALKIGNNEGHAWVSGPAVKPFVLERISRLRQYFPDMPLIGCGGVDSAEDILEMVMAGADLVQMLSGALLKGRQRYVQVCKGLVPAMEANGIPSVRQLRQEGFRRFPGGSGGRPHISETLCTGCQHCVRVCPFQAWSPAPPADDSNPKNRVRSPRLDVVSCIHCGLCESLCPAAAIFGVLS